MDPAQWQAVEALFESARHLDDGQRRRFVEKTRGEQPDLASALERLLVAEANAGDFLSSPVLELSVTGSAEDSASLRLGQCVGAYRLDRVIGSGGMGTVYLAERVDSAYEKQVAIKLIKGGMDTALVLRRFRMERQILANLDHPNIERLLDGGTTEDGLPYLVMEYIEGEAIDDYCEAHRLSVDERLELFRTVCDAVQHAHRKLVVHRDIKPSNILVTPSGVAKLLDFGIAKILAPRSGTGTTTTRSQRILTPEFASPEQIRGEPITTATDVYSLGVVLYRLLTGQGPYRLDTPSPLVIARVICEEEPTSPSTAVLRPDWLDGDPVRAPALADRLSRQLRGDLDTIVSMALRKEPEHRYASVADLSDDIGRHLGGHPVLARKRTLRYRSGKFVRRHRAAVFVTALLAGSVIFGAAGIVREGQRARRQADVSNQAIAYIDDVLRHFPSGGGANLSAIDGLLSRGADDVSRKLASQPEAQARVLDTIAGVYESYQLFDGALDARQTILELVERAHGETDPRVAEAKRALALVLLQKGQAERARLLLTEALDLQRDRLGDAHPELSTTLHALAAASWEDGDFDGAQALFASALELRREHGGHAPAALAAQLIDVGRFRSDLADYTGAEQLLRQALTLARLTEERDPVPVVRAMLHLAVAVHQQHRSAQADSLLIQALIKVRSAMGHDHPLVAEILRELSTVRRHRAGLLGLENLDDVPARRAKWLHEQAFGATHRETSRSRLVCARAEESVVEGEIAARASLAALREALPAGHLEIAEPLTHLAGVHLFSGAPDKGEPLLRDALEIRRGKLPHNHWKILHAQELLGLALLALGRFDEADSLLTATLDGVEGSGVSSHRVAERTLQDLVVLHTALGAFGRAERHQAALMSQKAAGRRILGDVDRSEDVGVKIDYDDDCVEKTIHVDAEELEGASTATVWIYGKPFNWEGRPFQDREDLVLRVNGESEQEVRFDVGLVFHQSTGTYQWAPIDVPLEWLRSGDNTLFLTEQSPEGSWDHNNLWVAVDTSADDDRSWWCSNDRTCCYGLATDSRDGSTRTGELMLFLSLEGVPTASDDVDHVARRIHREVADRLSAVGRSLLARGNSAAAERCFRGALERYRLVDPGSGDAASEVGLGTSLIASGKFDDAERYLLAHHDAQGGVETAALRRQVVEGLISLYRRWGRPREVSEYERILAGMPVPVHLQEPDPHKAVGVSDGRVVMKHR